MSSSPRSPICESNYSCRLQASWRGSGHPKVCMCFAEEAWALSVANVIWMLGIYNVPGSAVIFSLFNWFLYGSTAFLVSIVFTRLNVMLCQTQLRTIPFDAITEQLFLMIRALMLFPCLFSRLLTDCDRQSAQNRALLKKILGHASCLTTSLVCTGLVLSVPDFWMRFTIEEIPYIM